MSAFVVPVIAVVVVLAIVWVLARRWAAARQPVADELAGPATPTIDYLVPEGQDSAVVLAALVAEGFTATPDPAESHLLHVSASGELDRERVRSVIASVRTTALDSGVPFEPGEVRFADERGRR
jgi:hypothetical protein